MKGEVWGGGRRRSCLAIYFQLARCHPSFREETATPPPSVPRERVAGVPFKKGGAAEARTASQSASSVEVSEDGGEDGWMDGWLDGWFGGMDGEIGCL